MEVAVVGASPGGCAEGGRRRWGGRRGRWLDQAPDAGELGWDGPARGQVPPVQAAQGGWLFLRWGREVLRL